MASEDAVIAQVEDAHRHHSKTPFYVVWISLLVLTGMEVMLAYQQLSPVRMLSFLMALSIVKAALIIAWFMHMKYEMPRMRRIIMISGVVCLCLMCIFFPDAYRILKLGAQ
ncbi:MAG TPA: cytochrome C oxidase subunit IV family protein [Terriglobales bacterium]|nr:cytochrome C oxidase subunit IV family protein [Terriglobales bacterium]